MIPTETGERKTALRRHYAAVRAGLPPRERAAAEQAIFHTLFESPLWQNAAVICAYLSIRGEMDTRPILERARVEGKLVALPVTVTGAEQGRMVFRPLLGLEPHELPTGRFGIPEPPETHGDLSLRDFAGAGCAGGPGGAEPLHPVPVPGKARQGDLGLAVLERRHPL